MAPRCLDDDFLAAQRQRVTLTDQQVATVELLSAFPTVQELVLQEYVLTAAELAAPTPPLGNGSSTADEAGGE